MFPALVFASLAAFLLKDHVTAAKYQKVALIGGGMGMGMGGMGMGGMGMGGMGGMGGFEMDQGMFNEGKKNMEDMFWNKKEGNEGNMFDMGKKGIYKGEGIKKLKKGEEKEFKDYKGDKKKMAHEMGYQGGKKFGKQGKKDDEKKHKEGHKKGHGVKSFKTSHEKNENSKTEEFYDEEHDEGEKKGFAGAKGEFGEKKGTGFAGEKAEKEYKGGEQKKEGHYGEKILKDAEKKEEGKYDKKKYAGEKAGYELKKEGDLKKAGGHEEAEKMYKHYKHPMMIGR